jgi:orotidine-5'-phosphate decarboxylase
VKRDGRLIGKVNPSSIEPTQTIAEIDFKTISPGVRIQPGDSVILAKPASN